MKLTKDEARILAVALEDAKYELITGDHDFFDALNELQERLESAGQDNRRRGRTSMDDFSDCVKRFTKKSITQ